MASISMPGASAVLVLAHITAYGLALAYLWRRRHASLLRTGLLLPITLIVVYSIPEALSTLHGTWNNPTNEADAGIRLFLVWLGWMGLCLYLALWIVGWTLALDALESLRRERGGRRAVLLGFAQLYLLYALAMGNLDGYSSWTRHPSFFYHASLNVVLAFWQHIPASYSTPELTYVLLPPLFFALLCTFAHVGIRALGRCVVPTLRAKRKRVPGTLLLH